MPKDGNLNVLFLGRFYPCNLLKTIKEDTKGKVGFSNHNFEMSLIGGFARQENINLKVVTLPLAFSFPHHNLRAWIKAEKYHEGVIDYRSIGFCNVIGVNRYSPLNPLKKCLLSTFEKFPQGNIIVIQNTPDLLLSKALFNAIKQSQRKVKTILVIPDVPQCMTEMYGKETIKKKLMRRNNMRVQKLSNLYDKYVYLTEQMNDFYQANSNDYIVMEGLIDSINESESITVKSFLPEIILYTGTLSRIFGVMNLVDAFEKGNFKNTELWICGSGECADALRQKSIDNPRIKFFGLVDSNKARELQRKATILANPRGSEGEYTKYSFPSKTIEYLLSGNSVIMNRLPGIPDEYNDFLFYPENENIESWISKIQEILEMSKNERLALGRKAINFIRIKKSAQYQCHRILDLANK